MPIDVSPHRPEKKSNAYPIELQNRNLMGSRPFIWLKAEQQVPTAGLEERLMSIGTIILIILVIALLGGFSGIGGGPFYGTGYYGGGGLGLVVVILLILLLGLSLHLLLLLLNQLHQLLSLLRVHILRCSEPLLSIWR